MGLHVRQATAIKAFANLARREAYRAAGKDGWVSKQEQKSLPAFLRTAADAMRQRDGRGARVAVEDLVEVATQRAQTAWAKFNPPGHGQDSLYLSRAEVGAVAASDASLGQLTLKAWQRAKETAVSPRRPANFLTLPDVRQDTDYTCGAASLMSVLVYYGKFFDSESDLAAELETDPNWGTDPQDILRVSKDYELGAEMREQMTFADLEAALADKKPVIVCYQAWQYEDYQIPWETEWDSGHYSVVIGIDEHYVYLEDPSLVGEIGVIPRSEFMERWHDIDRTGHRLHQCGIVLSSDEPPIDVGRFAPIL